MATATTSIYCDGSSLANFNAWANWIYNQFIAFGWTQTADTGQGTFPATGSVPSSAGSYYAIFKSGDALSGACPIYVKIEFWASSNVPYFGLTVGTGGTDGAGNLLPPYTVHWSGSGTYDLRANSTSTTNLLPCYASGDAGSMRLVMWNGGTASPDYYNLVVILIGRMRDGAGNATSNGVHVWTWDQNGRPFQTVYSPSLGGSNAVDTTGYYIAAAPQVGNASWSNSGSILVSPVMQNIGGLSNVTPDVLMGGQKDFAANSSATVTVCGVAHTYLSCSTSQMYSLLQGQYCSLLVRYE